MAGWLHRYAPVNGLTMHYVEQGEGPLLVLCHGFPHTWFLWHRQIAALAAEWGAVLFHGSVHDVDLEAWHGEEPLARITDQYEDAQRIEMIAGAGHPTQLERSDEVTRLMADFLDDIAERGAPP